MPVVSHLAYPVPGLGAAWHEREHTAFGISYPPLSERFEMMEETLQICLQMWSDDGPYEGKHYRVGRSVRRNRRSRHRMAVRK